MLRLQPIVTSSIRLRGAAAQIPKTPKGKGQQPAADVYKDSIDPTYSIDSDEGFPLCEVNMLIDLQKAIKAAWEKNGGPWRANHLDWVSELKEKTAWVKSTSQNKRHRKWQELEKAHHSAKVGLANYKEDLAIIVQYENEWDEHHPEMAKYVATVNTASEALELLDAACMYPVSKGSSLVSTTHLKPKLDPLRPRRRWLSHRI